MPISRARARPHELSDEDTRARADDDNERDRSHRRFDWRRQAAAFRKRARARDCEHATRWQKCCASSIRSTARDYVTLDDCRVAAITMRRAAAAICSRLVAPAIHVKRQWRRRRRDGAHRLLSLICRMRRRKRLRKLRQRTIVSCRRRLE